MMRSLRHWVPAVVLVALALAGCSGGSAPAAPPDPFPPRPAAIDIERIDPCATLTAQQLAPFGVGVEDERAGTAPVGGVTSRACAWSNLEADFGYSVQLIPRDAAEAAGGPGTVVGAIEGYGTVQVTDRETTAPLCEIYVDVNDGQVFRIQARANAKRPDGSLPPIDEVCRRAEVVTAESLRTARSLTS